MKIGILTQALRVNYGCLMQNYALQQTRIVFTTNYSSIFYKQ